MIMTATERAANKVAAAIVEYALQLHRQEGTDLPVAVSVATEMTLGLVRQMHGTLLHSAQEALVNGPAAQDDAYEASRGGAW